MCTNNTQPIILYSLFGSYTYSNRHVKVGDGVHLLCQAGHYVKEEGLGSPKLGVYTPNTSNENGLS